MKTRKNRKNGSLHHQHHRHVTNSNYFIIFILVHNSVSSGIVSLVRAFFFLFFRLHCFFVFKNEAITPTAFPTSTIPLLVFVQLMFNKLFTFRRTAISSHTSKCGHQNYAPSINDRLNNQIFSNLYNSM